MSWMTFVSDCKLVSRRCPAGECELVWSIVNAMDEGTKEVDVVVTPRVREEVQRHFGCDKVSLHPLKRN